MQRPFSLSGIKERLRDSHIHPFSSKQKGPKSQQHSGGKCNQCEPFIYTLNENIWKEPHHGLRKEITFSKDVNCKICSSVRQAFRNSHGDSDADFAETQSFLIESISPMMGLEIYFLWPAIRLSAQPRKGVYLLPLDVPSGEAPGRAINPELVDIGIIQNWLQCCETWHGTVCNLGDIQPLDGVEMLRVIDVERGCLVHIPSSSRYIALSYVWGTAKTLQTVKANVKELEKEGAFFSHFDELPHTIRDAIKLVSHLGEQHLWIDALCIVQDNIAEKVDLIGQMDKIYQNAFLTIVAAAGSNANAGLPGVDENRPRKIPQQALQYGEGRSLAISQAPFEKLLGRDSSSPRSVCTWNKRAWTHQERLLSGRKLIFLEDGVHFNCQKITWTEDVNAEKENIHRHFQMYDFEGVTDEDRWFSGVSRLITSPRKRDEWTLRGSDATFPSFIEYCNLVSNHMRRDLSFEEDILDSFQGILNQLTLVFGPFQQGLPELFLSLALLWQPKDYCRRRRRIKNSTGPTDADFPSWSWAAWLCNLDVDHWRAACDYLVHADIQSSYRTTPTAQFLDEGPTPSHYEVRDKWLRYRLEGCQSADQWSEILPKTWERREVKPHVYLGREVSCDFRLQNDQSREFLYPISFPGKNVGRTQPTEKLKRDVLTLSAKVARFTISPKHKEYPDRPNAASILDEAGEWCGIVILHERLPQADSYYEFVGISEGEVFTGLMEKHIFPEVSFVKYWEGPDFYRYQNVILTKKQDHLRYRIGIGRIRNDAWGAVEKEVQSVLLG